MERYGRRENFLVPLKATKHFPLIIKGVLGKNRKKQKKSISSATG